MAADSTQSEIKDSLKGKKHKKNMSKKKKKTKVLIPSMPYKNNKFYYGIIIHTVRCCKFVNTIDNYFISSVCLYVFVKRVLVCVCMCNFRRICFILLLIYFKWLHVLK